MNTMCPDTLNELVRSLKFTFEEDSAGNVICHSSNKYEPSVIVSTYVTHPKDHHYSGKRSVRLASRVGATALARKHYIATHAS